METTAIDFMPAIEQVLMVLGGLLLTALTAAAKKAMDYFGVKADEAAVERIEKALKNGISKSRSNLVSKIEGKLKDNPIAKERITREAAEYAIKQVPDAVKRIKYNKEDPRLQDWAGTLMHVEEEKAAS